MTAFKAIKDYEGLYAVSALGDVLSVRKDKILTPSRTKKGYMIVNLSKHGVTTTRYVHHLVLEAFVGLRPEGLQCRHLNGDKEKNWISNLAWGTAQENAEDNKRFDVYRCVNKKRTEELCLRAKKLRSQGLTYKKIGEELDLSIGTAYRACHE